MLSVMIDSESYKLRVIKILADIAQPRKQISCTTRIYHDLLISGDDAAELIDRIHGEFGTSFRGFDFGKYFPMETESLFQRLVLLFGGAVKTPMTVGHLIDVIEAGMWFDVGSHSGE